NFAFQYPQEAHAFLDLLQENTAFNAPEARTMLYVFHNAVKKHGLEKAVEIFKGKHVFVSLEDLSYKLRKRKLDYKRYGKPILEKHFSTGNASSSVLESLNQKGIKLFDFGLALRKVASSSNIVSLHRHALVFEVPEFEQLKNFTRGQKGFREHLKGSFFFADLKIYLPTKGNFIFVQEIQSDLFRYLPENLQKKFDSFDKIGLLSVAKLAKSMGIKEMVFSSPNLMKSIWPGISQKTLHKTYFDVPQELGFNLIKLPSIIVDSSHGSLNIGRSDVVWHAKIEDLEKKYQEFFKIY
ncbi:MAG: hypothetical protein V1847_04790, partial [Candidatus Diapherotrites archaeon]